MSPALGDPPDSGVSASAPAAPANTSEPASAASAARASALQWMGARRPKAARSYRSPLGRRHAATRASGARSALAAGSDQLAVEPEQPANLGVPVVARVHG